MLFYPVEISQTTAGSPGTISFNTLTIGGGMCYQVILKSATSTTTFDFKMTDDKSNIVYDTLRKDLTATGTLDDSVRLPMRGKYTLTIYNASTNELFSGRLLIQT